MADRHREASTDDLMSAEIPTIVTFEGGSLGTHQEGGAWVHVFGHSMHPVARRRVFVYVPATVDWTPGG